MTMKLILLWILSLFIDDSIIVALQRPIIIPRRMTLASNYLGFKLLNELNNNNHNNNMRSNDNEENDLVRKNILLSPLSITATLMMIYLATKENSSDSLQLESLLNLFNLNENDGRRSEESIRKLLKKNPQLKTNRILLANQTLKMNLNFATIIQEIFSTEIVLNQHRTDFSIVNGSTFIENYPESYDAITLFDRASFQAQWLFQFDLANTRPSTFYGTNFVSYRNIPFMKLRAPVSIVPLDEIDAALIELPFKSHSLKDQNYAMYLILPARINDDLSLIRRALNPWYLESMIRRLNVYGKILIELPTFGIEAEYSLRETLNKMGITDIFKKKNKNLSVIDYGEDIFLTDIIHKVQMEVSENGIGSVEAIKLRKKKRNLYDETTALSFDHPFLYIVRNTKTGAILLIGEIHGF